MSFTCPVAPTDAICECPEHEGPPSSENLRPIYRERQSDGRPCYEWWCDGCQEAAEELDEDDTLYEEAIHCTMIPGLD